MILGRWLGWLLLIAAIVMAGGDALHAWQTGIFVPTPLSAVWQRLDPSSLSRLQAAGPVHLHPAVWRAVVQPVLNWPGWADFGALGLILLLLCRRRQPKRRRRFSGH